ncbi:MAG TPA: threonine ammonia-lyase [Bacteriovoracaceae bacterium]|nr:threonine ammonia-lyase [Bacteriovoracaceae bacterium]
MKLENSQFKKAFAVLNKIIDPTPLIFNEWLSNKYDCQIYLKLENMLPIGSFKMRGATYKISQMTAAEKKQGVLAVSAGNHAQGVAWAARRFGIKATIVMPEGSPLTKIRNTEALGAKVILHGHSIEDGFVYATEMMKKKKMVFVHPYHDPMVIAGQGSVAYELLEQIPDMDFIFSSIGGGGLVSGIGQVLKNNKCKAKVIAGQATGCSAMVDSLNKGKVTQIATASTFADGIRVKNVSQDMFDLLREVVDSCHTVDDEKMAWAILQLMEKARVIAEGAGALPLALLDQLYQVNPKKFKGKKVVLVICGGNIDVNLLERIIDRGLLESNRKVRISIPISDKPGVLHDLTRIIKDVGANILQVVHDRDSSNTGISGTNVLFTLETKGEDHLRQLLKEMKKDFPQSSVVN